LGNHDAHYLFSSGLLRSSGYSWGTAAVINGWPDKNRYTSGLKFCTNVGKWWLSHAGLLQRPCEASGGVCPAACQWLPTSSSGRLVPWRNGGVWWADLVRLVGT
jgi:hypothetical protein